MKKGESLLDYAIMLLIVAIIVIVIAALLGEELGNLIRDFLQ